MADTWSNAALAGRPHDDAERLVADAERAIDRFAGTFAGEVARQTDRLDAAFRRLSAPGVRAGGDANLFPDFTEVFEVAHEIKGQAGSFGYDLLTHVCESLCCVVDNRRRICDQVVDVVGHHIMAIHVIVGRDLKGLGGDFGAALLRELGHLKTCMSADAPRR